MGVWSEQFGSRTIYKIFLVEPVPSRTKPYQAGQAIGRIGRLRQGDEMAGIWFLAPDVTDEPRWSGTWERSLRRPWSPPNGRSNRGEFVVFTPRHHNLTQRWSVSLAFAGFAALSKNCLWRRFFNTGRCSRDSKPALSSKASGRRRNCRDWSTLSPSWRRWGWTAGPSHYFPLKRLARPPRKHQGNATTQPGP